VSEPDKRPNLFARLKGALEEGVRFAQGDVDLRTTAVPDRPPTWHAPDIRRLRERLELSQGAFAGMLNVSLKTVQSWEQGERQPAQAALRLLQVLAADPSVVCKIIGFPLRRRQRPHVGKDHSTTKSPEPLRQAKEAAG
jgi:putative transcriptional regulator